MPIALRLPVAEPSPTRLFRMTAEKRNIPRVAISIGGRFMREDRTEYGGTATEASVQAISIETEIQCRVGERIIGIPIFMSVYRMVVTRQQLSFYFTGNDSDDPDRCYLVQ